MKNTTIKKALQINANDFTIYLGIRGGIMAKESRILEFKQDTNSSTFLKTVSAFANYNGGEIVFGVTDDGIAIGIKNPQEACLALENKINDSIDPMPEYSLRVEEDSTIHLSIQAGIYKPYLYKGKAYRRNDTSTVEVDRTEYNHLMLLGLDKSYEELSAYQQSLTFDKLEQELVQTMNIAGLNQDILKTLELYSDKNGYNHAAELLSDHNGFAGLDIIRFGGSIDEIMERKTCESVSILSQMEESVLFFKRYYQYEKITGARREIVDKIPEKAFREAIANALVHRRWDIKASIKISMFTDRIEISSPGGLPEGMSEEEYLNGQVSLLRNPIIGNVFFRLKHIEKFGTGILRIKNAYADSLIKPEFGVYLNSIRITLPILEKNITLSEEERKIVRLLQENEQMDRGEITEILQISKDKTIRLLNNLLEKRVIARVGKGRGTRYQLP